MIIHPAELSEADGQAVVRSRIEYAGRDESLWYSVNAKYRRYLVTEKLDGFLVGVLLLAMKLGEDIVLEGPVSEKLLYNLTHSYMNLVHQVMPSLRVVRIRPATYADPRARDVEGAVGTGFSAGIDSLCAVHEHLGEEVPPSHRLTHLVCNNVGAYGNWQRPEQARALFQARFDLTKGYAEEVGLELIRIDSNLSQILEWNAFVESHVPRNLSSVLLLQKLFSKYYYASAYRYKDCRFRETRKIAQLDPAAVHLLSTETLDCISTGCEYSRTEKIRRVASVEAAERWLNVCARNEGSGENCSTCWKCCRTLLTLEILGELERFSRVFDLARWREVRNRYVITSFLMRSQDPRVVEQRELAAERGYVFPWWQRAVARVLDLSPGPLYRRLRDLRRRALGRGLTSGARGAKREHSADPVRDDGTPRK